MRYIVAAHVYGIVHYKDAKPAFNEALQAALELDESLDSGDHGISFIYDVARNKELQVGNGAFRNGVNTQWCDSTPELRKRLLDARDEHELETFHLIQGNVIAVKALDWADIKNRTDVAYDYATRGFIVKNKHLSEGTES